MKGMKTKITNNKIQIIIESYGPIKIYIKLLAF